VSVVRDVKFDFSRLLGRIRERGFTQEGVSSSIGIASGTLSAKLNNKGNFTAPEIESISRMLGIPKDEIGAYFFTPKVQKN
jgi:transcriptional regulator with XRE-family HTH domain